MHTYWYYRERGRASIIDECCNQTQAAHGAAASAKKQAGAKQRLRKAVQYIRFSGHLAAAYLGRRRQQKRHCLPKPDRELSVGIGCGFGPWNVMMMKYIRHKQ